MGTGVDPTSPCYVSFQPVGRRVEVEPGLTLIETAQTAGVEIVSICGGIGVCGECRVRVAAGNEHLSPPTLTEDIELTDGGLNEGLRLACQARVLGDVRIDIPPESLAAPQRLQVEGQFAEVEVDLPVRAVDLSITPPGLYDLRSDLERVQDALREAGEPRIAASLRVLTELPRQLRLHDWQVRVVLRGIELVALLPHPRTGDDVAQPTATVKPHSMLGLAVDVGTTKVAAYLVDLRSGATLAKIGAMNPQIAFGEDVISRIAYANTHPEGLHTLQRRLVETLNGMVAELCRTAGAELTQIVEAVVVGNTAMHHLLAGLPVEQLGEAPYVPAVGEAMQFHASDIGLELASGAYVYMPPNIAGYVGADHVAMLLAAQSEQLARGRAQHATIALDIGTNTEISLLVGERILCCSCASGPAFEGAHIHDGMRAAPGAVERVRIEEDQVHVHTIEGQPAVGICGSGILDAVAEMLSASVVDRRGALSPTHHRVCGEGGRRAFVLVPGRQTGTGRDVLVTRGDVNEIQLAKGAIRAGIEVLLGEAGIRAGEIDDFVVAGAFGTYLDLRSAVRVGMFPDLPIERYRQVGNAAGAGARTMLVSRRQRALAEEAARRIEYVELTTHPRFTEEYMGALSFDAPTGLTTVQVER
jgi:uncharacterized 2Fe-2S/4Fe-4S cluster protein (DUF4445 family)